MARKTKTKSTKTKTTRTKKTVATTPVVATPVVATPVVATPVVTTPVVTTPVVKVTEPTLTDGFNELLSQLQGFRSQITRLSAQLRTLRSRSEREIKQALKTSRRRRNPNRKPSGFVKPALISNELADFLGHPTGTEMARTSVTKEINQYILAHNLQDPSNGRIIRADSKLRKLLRLKKTDAGEWEQLTYFNLQRFMSPHFPKTGAAAAAAAAIAVATSS